MIPQEVRSYRPLEEFVIMPSFEKSLSIGLSCHGGRRLTSHRRGRAAGTQAQAPRKLYAGIAITGKTDGKAPKDIKANGGRCLPVTRRHPPG